MVLMVPLILRALVNSEYLDLAVIRQVFEGSCNKRVEDQMDLDLIADVCKRKGKQSSHRRENLTGHLKYEKRKKRKAEAKQNLYSHELLPEIDSSLTTTLSAGQWYNRVYDDELAMT